MLNEFKILFKNFRKQILSEGVGEGTIVDAINNHKIIYIYYAGDDTVLKGYRTIKPFVLGNHRKSGNLVLRAWQDAGSSDSYRGLNRTRRQDHEYHFDHKGRQKPGWRLFKVDAITSFLPTGEKFNPSNIIDNSRGVNYNPNDKDMSTIIASIKPIPAKSTQVTGTDSIEEPDLTATKVDKGAFDTQTSKFQRFFSAAEKSREATKDEIEHLYNINNQIKKKSAKNMWVVQNEKGDMTLKDQNAKEKLPQESIVGNLHDLYQKFVVPSRTYGNDFFTSHENSINKK